MQTLEGVGFVELSNASEAAAGLALSHQAPSECALEKRGI